ncbi:kinesin motor domain protein [Ichthyophthirius multifiliis]|uniref:Kinesin-like protein n=1 Tax=Ichthyophthirius multifiliis TaxID=5932 RepID=G0QR10_ICHMU|nr:kinesin motor domain protein [Ichthyophthirius multifiliis]EGR32343.1 kinesin motor domain protein [Ichthyophthirius multifiliis]|eukprot:XP_004035829.1 kinesin motor domain protein [Ichthyophthirius multifiliis]
MKSQLQVYARLKPHDNKEIPFDIDKQNKKLFIGSKLNRNQIINNNKDTFEYNFADILDYNTTQDQVFNQVAIPVVQNCLDGYNGTIFAYGQTGSGKTYTISGSEQWVNRGIIPRVMSYVFDQIDQRQNQYEYRVYVSYMEIYNEKAYNLLNEDHLITPIEQWNKVIQKQKNKKIKKQIEFKRDNQGNIHLNNISLHEIDDAKPGIDLLMMGNYIRKQAATPMNQNSSRSHCIFTLTFEVKHIESNTCFVSKLNLVDLAGSERTSKTNHDGVLLNEAKYINLSLSYLEQVIVTLNEKKKNRLRQHIPYRQSILTTLLKDSLGGNCKTVMVCTVSMDMDNYEETLSALRFSQRVGQLENEIHVNEKVDLKQTVQKLQVEKKQLIQELQKYQQIVGDINNYQLEEQKQSCKFYENNDNLDYKDDDDYDLDQILTKVDQYMNEKIDNLEVKDLEEAKLCFRAMKELHNSRMEDYLKELYTISKKLQQYDEFLPQKNQFKK